jgi:hypothetical protein
MHKCDIEQVNYINNIKQICKNSLIFDFENQELRDLEKKLFNILLDLQI